MFNLLVSGAALVAAGLSVVQIVECVGERKWKHLWFLGPLSAASITLVGVVAWGLFI